MLYQESKNRKETLSASYDGSPASVRILLQSYQTHSTDARVAGGSQGQFAPERRVYTVHRAFDGRRLLQERATGIAAVDGS